MGVSGTASRNIQKNQNVNSGHLQRQGSEEPVGSTAGCCCTHVQDMVFGQISVLNLLPATSTYSCSASGFWRCSVDEWARFRKCSETINGLSARLVTGKPI